ncbi:MAG TPA: ABC transporter substrate-binding protein, partial [Gaiellaceae bacterium]|nr:ABC transporter substrate-binding protein [Gaiellaceae bacterium]
FQQSMRNSLPLASGPFRFVSWDRGSQLTVERNPNYWGKKANLQRIVFRFIPDTNTQFQALRSGEVNIIVPQPQLQIADIRKQKNITVQQSLQFAWEHIDLQTGPGGHPALRKKFVRQAIFTGINRRQIATALYREIAPNIPVLNNVIFKPFQPEYVAHKYQPFGFSQQKAIQLLRSNGCTGGPARPGAGGVYSCPGVGQLEFDFYSTAGNQLRELAFAIIQKQLASVGIKLNSKFSLTALSVTLPTKKWDIMMFAWLGSPEPAGSVNIHRCNGLQNYYGYCSRPATRLLLKSNEEFDPKKRTALLNAFDKLHASHAASLPLFARPAFQIHDSRLKGAILNPTNSGPTWQTENWSFAR